VALEGDLAVVGAYGYGEFQSCCSYVAPVPRYDPTTLSHYPAERNVGRVFVYRYHLGSDTWDLMDQLTPVRAESNFGYSVDLHKTSIIVGANGYYKYQFENNQQFDARLTRKSLLGCIPCALSLLIFPYLLPFLQSPR
jgi:hypothetical protein